MKALFLLLPALLLCACGESDLERNNRLTALKDKMNTARERVSEIELAMLKMKPGGEMEVASSQLKDAKAEYEGAKKEWDASLKK